MFFIWVIYIIVNKKCQNYHTQTDSFILIYHMIFNKTIVELVGWYWYAMWLPFSLTHEGYLNPNHTVCWYTGWITSLLLEVQCTGEAGWESQYHQYSRCRILETLQISTQSTCLTLSSWVSWLPKLWVNQYMNVFE